MSLLIYIRVDQAHSVKFTAIYFKVVLQEVNYGNLPLQVHWKSFHVMAAANQGPEGSASHRTPGPCIQIWAAKARKHIYQFTVMCPPVNFVAQKYTNPKKHLHIYT